MVLDREKFKALVQYICWKCEDPSRLGAVKLNKALWFSDLLTYLNLGVAITGARYVKRQFGPVPTALLPIIGELQQEGALAVREGEYWGFAKREFFALKKPEMGQFSGEEISIVDLVIERVCYEHTAASISDLTHNDVWDMADIGEELPYCTIFAARRGEITEDDTAWADAEIEALNRAA